MKARKTIGNVNVLDLRRASEEYLDEPHVIGNVGTVLHAQGAGGLPTGLTIGNVGGFVELSPDAQVLTTSLVINRHYLKDRETPLDVFVSGHVLVEPDVAPDDVETGLGQLSVSGPFICPEHLLARFQPKIGHVGGPTVTYGPSGRVFVGKLVLDENQLRGMDDGSEVVVIGALRLPKVVPNDLLESKISRLHVSGSVRCHEENADVIGERLVDKSARIKTIPAGFELVERALTLDGMMFRSLPSGKLYCTDRVQVAADVDADVLDEHLDRLVTTDLLLCPARLQGTMSQKCDLLETEAIFYEGELWLYDQADTLSASRFDYLDGKATVVVFGSLKIDPQIDPKLLADRFAKVHNLGVVSCTPEQKGAIQARLGLSRGKLVDSTPKEEKEEKEEKRQGVIGNVNYLAL